MNDGQTNEIPGPAPTAADAGPAALPAGGPNSCVDPEMLAHGLPNAPLVARALWQIEMRLKLPTDLDTLAERCSVSPWHLARAFRAATGLAPMAYLRARRLTEAAKVLATGTVEILPVALDHQYASHEAFTRAFAQTFGQTPRAVRMARSLDTLTLTEPMDMDKSLIIEIDAPEVREAPELFVVGLAEDCTFETASKIPALWQRFNERIGEVAQVGGYAAYGVCLPKGKPGNFRYVAALAADQSAPLPKGMESVTLPAHRFAVFTHKGHISDFGKTVYTIWNKGLSDHGLSPAFGIPDFERYDERFDAGTGRGEVEVWIPIKDA